MHKLFRSRLVCMYIFALTHHLATISATASDLLSSTISSSSLLSLPLLPSSSSSASASATFSSTGKAQAVIATTSSGDAPTKTTTDLFAIENDVAAKEISIAASLSSSSASSSLSASAGIYAQPDVTSSSSSPSPSLSTFRFEPLEQQGKLAGLRRQTRSLYNLYPFGNLYTGYAGISGAYYRPYPSYLYAYPRPTFFNLWGACNPYYGYLHITLG